MWGAGQGGNHRNWTFTLFLLLLERLRKTNFVIKPERKEKGKREKEQKKERRNERREDSRENDSSLSLSLNPRLHLSLCFPGFSIVSLLAILLCRRVRVFFCKLGGASVGGVAMCFLSTKKEKERKKLCYCCLCCWPPPPLPPPPPPPSISAYSGLSLGNSDTTTTFSTAWPRLSISVGDEIRSRTSETPDL